MKQHVTKLLIVLALILSPNRSASHAQSADLAVASVYLPLVSVPPVPVRINESESQRTIDGRFRLVGDIVNVANYPVYDVALQVWLYDNLSQLLYTGTWTTVLTATLPSQLNPFDIPTNYPDCHPLYPCVSRWEAAITGWSLDSDRTYLPVTIVSIHVENVTPNYTAVKVEVRNDNPQALSDVKGVAWSMYQCAPIRSQSAAAVLAPGETTYFLDSLPCVDSDTIPTIKAIAQGYIVP